MAEAGSVGVMARTGRPLSPGGRGLITRVFSPVAGVASRDNRTNTSLNNEWVTVVNTGRGAVSLSGWTLTGASRHTYRFTHLRLAGHSAVRVHTGVGRDTTRDVYQDRREYVWNNDHDAATLRDSRGHAVDSKSWGHRHHR